jgi:hypothetical protein
VVATEAMRKHERRPGAGNFIIEAASGPFELTAPPH